MDPMPEEARQRRAQTAMARLGVGGTVTPLGPYQFQVVYPRKRVNHGLHILITLLTCGLYVFVWAYIAAVAEKQDRLQVVTVDEYGAVWIDNKLWWPVGGEHEAPALDQAMKATEIAFPYPANATYLALVAAAYASADDVRTDPQTLGVTFKIRVASSAWSSSIGEVAASVIEGSDDCIVRLNGDRVAARNLTGRLHEQTAVRRILEDTAERLAGAAET